MSGENKTNVRTNVAVLMGGLSAEREISIKSGTAVLKALANEGVPAVGVDVRSENFHIPDGTDVVFLALHGTFGEDGAVQTILDERGIPYTGSCADASALAFDKARCKQVFVSSSVPTARWIEIARPVADTDLGYPVAVKPSCQGSSLGISIVRCAEDLEAATRRAFEYDSRVLVERYVEGLELTVGIFEDCALPVIEIAPGAEFFDFEAKYTKGKSDYRVPAPLVPPQMLLVQHVAERAFHALGCRDYGRVDLILGHDKVPYVLEVNTLPGMTETSLLPMAAAQEDITFGDLCVRMIDMALQRKGMRPKTTQKKAAA